MFDNENRRTVEDISKLTEKLTSCHNDLPVERVTSKIKAK